MLLYADFSQAGPSQTPSPTQFQNKETSDTHSSTKSFILTPELGIDQPKNILVLLSWSPLFPWSQSMQQGLISAIEAQDESIQLYVESMYESPTFSTSARYNFDLGLRAKYENIKFDGIIADSRAAFDYLQALPIDDPDFGQIPTYFIYFTQEDILSKPYQKTIMEAQQDSIKKTLLFMYESHPTIDTLHIISNDQYIYQPYIDAIEHSTAELGVTVDIQFYDYADLSQYQSQVSQIPENDVIIYLPTFISNQTRNLNAQQVLAQIAPHASVPIYSFWHNFVGAGAVGGNLMNPHFYGVDAIQSILSYQKDGYFTKTEELGEWIFDEKILKQFNLSFPSYVSSYKRINAASTIWADYPIETASFIVFFAFIILLVFVYKQNRLSKALKYSKIAEKEAAANALRISNLSKTKSKFIATMSHEIRTPINGIFGALSLMAKQSPSKNQRQYLDMAQYCTENLLNTVNDVLDFSRMDSGQFEIIAKPFSPVTLLNDVYRYAQLISKDTDLIVKLEVDTLVDVPLLGDKMRLQQVLNNLLNNAVKFTPKGSVTIIANIESNSDSHYQLNISITDTGIGISKDDINKLFSPFIQINDTLERSQEGSGLGLSICKEIINLMQGTIHVESTLGQGSRFHVELRLPLAEEQIETNSQYPMVNQASIEHKTCNILLVEDNKINQAVMRSQLEQLGHQVTIGDNGQHALEILAAHTQTFDVVLMDIQMPVLNGYDTTLAIRNGEVGSQYQKMPILALTAHASLDEHESINVEVFNHYLIKPVQEHKLQAALNASCR